MTLPLTKEMLAAAYSYLRTTPPFNRWKLPPAHQVRFIVGKATSSFAQYQWDGTRHTITVSSNAVAHTSTLINTMAHEIIHLHLYATDQESLRSDSKYHNATFRKYAAQVCKCHGFDPKAFY